MKYKVLASFLSIFFFVFLFVSCKKDKQVPADGSTLPGTKSIQGKVQKGPYKNGSQLIIYALNNSLGQTGNSFSSTLNDDAGNFSLNNINLTSNYILITATGYYFNEHFNITSQAQLYLEAISDVSNISTVNVNILTHIIKPRIEHLVSTGLTFSAARAQAQNEFLIFTGVNGGVNSNFETFDISNNDFLFAMSLLFQRNNSFGYQMGYNYTAELSTLLSNFRNDFANNGAIDNLNIIDTLIYNANRIDLIDCKNDMQNYYSGLGLSFSGNGFDQYIYNFQKKYSLLLSSNISFQDSGAVKIDAAMLPYYYRENLLKVNKKAYNASAFLAQFIISAIVPYDSSLVIKLTPFNSSFISLDPSSCFGWKQSQVNPSIIFEAQRKNIALSYLVQASGDSVKIEYFKNSSTSTPFYSKNIVFY